MRMDKHRVDDMVRNVDHGFDFNFLSFEVVQREFHESIENRLLFLGSVVVRQVVSEEILHEERVPRQTNAQEVSQVEQRVDVRVLLLTVLD